MNRLDKHAMVDLETLGTGTLPPLLSIGALEFDPWTSRVGEAFYMRVDPDTTYAYGALPTFGTIAWWATGEDVTPEARAEAFAKERANINHAIWEWIQWCQREKITHLWSHGISFDIAILMRYCEKLNRKWPVHFRNNCDTRTFWAAVPPAPLDLEHVVVPEQFVTLPKHHPVRDCWAQAVRTQIVMARLGFPGEFHVGAS